MKNSVSKIGFVLIAVLFLISITAMFAQAQSSQDVKLKFESFVDSLSVVSGLPYGSEAQNIKIESYVYSGRNITLWGRFIRSYNRIEKNNNTITSTNSSNQVITAQNTLDTTRMLDSEFIMPPSLISSLSPVGIACDSIMVKSSYTYILYEHGDILISDNNSKDYEHKIFNYTKGVFLPSDVMQYVQTTELCKSKLARKYRKNIRGLRFFVVGAWSADRVASKVKCLKGVFSMDIGKDNEVHAVGGGFFANNVFYNLCKGRLRVLGLIASCGGLLAPKLVKHRKAYKNN